MEHRIQQLELKLAEQEQVNAGLRDDIKSLKEIQHGNRTEYIKGFEHYEQKKKKFAGVLEEANISIFALQDRQELFATKEELQSLSQRLDDLKTLVDRNVAGMHASDSPQASDLMVFSPDRSLIHFDETMAEPADSPAGREAQSKPQLLHSQARNTISSLIDAGNRGAVSPARGHCDDAPSVGSSVTNRAPSPIVHISPPAATINPVNHDQTAQMAKRVRFDLSAQRVDSTPSDSGSEDPLAPDATFRKSMLSNKARNITATSEDSPLITAKSSKSTRRKPATARKSVKGKPSGILDQFKDGRLNSDSEDEEQAPVHIQNQTPVSDSQDTKATINLAERAVASLVEAAINGAAAGIRRSRRVPKQKDFGDVEVHGWKTKRARRS